MLTKGNLTRDEQSHLLRVLNRNILTFSCSHFQTIEKPNTMSKRGKEIRTAEELLWVESRPVSLIDIKKFQRESVSRVGFGYIIQRGELQIGLAF